MKNLKQTLLIVTMLITSTIVNAQWTQTQLGNDIDGEAAFDQSGRSVSISSDGNMVAIGAKYNDGNGSDAGHVRIYQYSATAWTQLGSDIDGEAADDMSGCSVSLNSNGNTVAIGADGNDGNGSNAGHVRVYRYNGTSWIQLGSDIDGEAASDESGYSVSLSSDGNTVAIGAESNDGNGSDAGHVRVYHYNGSSWTQLGSDIDGEAAGDLSGCSVSLSYDGSVVAIGAKYNGGNGSYAGNVRIYKDSSGTWVQVGSDIDGEAAFDHSGYSVSLSSDGNTVAIGARSNDGNGSYAGHVRVYQYSATAWTQIGNDIDGETSGDQSGYSVSLSSDGNTVAIGALYNDGNGSQAGHARVYRYSAAIWTQIGSDIDGEAASDESGYSVSLSSDGNTVAIGARSNGGNGNYAGHVRVYHFCFNTSSIDTQTACDSLLWIDGNTYTSNNDTATHIINNAAGCDSTITLDLTVNYSNTGTDTQTACYSYLWIDGNTYTSNNNTATHTLSNVAGCDSVVTLDLTINTVDVSVTTASATLTANLAGATYQWIMCPYSFPIGNATNQSFSPPTNGYYAVIINDGTCIDTSACYYVSGVGIGENENTSPIHIYPNPTSGVITIDGKNIEAIEVLNINGQIIKEIAVTEEQFNIDLSSHAKGVYFINIKTDKGIVIEKIVIE